jgi:broad specificity phosphatase PhoE
MLPLDSALEGKRLYLMRHGKTYEPDLDAPMVSADDDPNLELTPDGRVGVERTAQAMAGLSLEAAWSSTFLRSRQTAGIVTQPHGLDVHTRSELEELRLYPEGGDLRATARAYVDVARTIESRGAAAVRIGVAGQERGLDQIVDEAFGALHDCLRGPADRVLIVAHGGLNRLLLTGLMGLPLHRFISIDQDFGCVNVIEFVRRGRPWVRAINATTDDPFKGEEIRA